MLHLDIHTIILILGFTHLLQVLVFYHQYRVNRTYEGLGWWVLWSAAEVLGFFIILARDVPEFVNMAIMIQNSAIVAGTLFIFVGVRKFFGQNPRFKLLFTLFLAYVLFLAAFTFIWDEIAVRSAVFSFLLAGIAFLTAWNLARYRSESIKSAAIFNSVVFMVHGVIFLYRAILIVSGHPVEGIFSPTFFNLVAYFDALIVSLLWTFGFIIMVNQRLNNELRLARDHFETIFNTNPDAAIITRMDDGMIVNINGSFTALSGYTLEDVAGKTSLDIDLWKFPSERERIVAILREQGSCHNLEASFAHKNGTEIIGLVSTEIIDLNGVSHLLSVTRDITDRKRAEQEIIRLNSEMEERVVRRTSELMTVNKELEGFTYTVSHDLRAPLRALNGFANILQEEHAGNLDAEGRRLLNIIAGNAVTMGMLIDDLLAFSHLGRREIRITRINMKEMAAHAYREVTNETEQAKIRFTLHDIPDAEADPSLIHLVWTNLIGNAVKFSENKADRMIEIGYVADEQGGSYYVKDNGAGFDMAYENKLFGVFQRLHGMDEFAGTGVGLAMVHRVLKRMHGSIRAEGRVNEGATFYFSIPVQPSA